MTALCYLVLGRGIVPLEILEEGVMALIKETKAAK